MKARIRRFMVEPDSDDFGLLALDLFRYQWDRNKVYRDLVLESGMDPGAVVTWQDIPAVSTTVFKRLVLTCGHPTILFRTSGTSRGHDRRGEHHLVDADLYRESLLLSFRRFVLSAPMPLVILAPMPSWAPDSSLGFMMQVLMDEFGSPGSLVGLEPDGLDMPGLLRCFEDAERDGLPLALLGTSLALHNLIERLDLVERSFRFSPGSRIMDTGGSKGIGREIPRHVQLAGYSRVFDIPASRVVNEYGMTELASQFYDASLSGGDPEVKLAPHWVRTRVIDPATGRDAVPGETGLLVHFDLANMDSVAAIETEDLGFSRGAGFVLVGRTTGAEPRGCSIASDLLLGRGEV